MGSEVINIFGIWTEQSEEEGQHSPSFSEMREDRSALVARSRGTALRDMWCVRNSRSNGLHQPRRRSALRNRAIMEHRQAKETSSRGLPFKAED